MSSPAIGAGRPAGRPGAGIVVMVACLGPKQRVAVPDGGGDGSMTMGIEGARARPTQRLSMPGNAFRQVGEGDHRHSGRPLRPFGNPAQV